MALCNIDADALIASGAPILCLDTCSVLDLMRDVTRDDLLPADARAALFILSKMETEQELYALLAEQVRHELNDHLVHIQEDAQRAIEKWQSRTSRVDEIAAIFGAPARAEATHLDQHVDRARTVVDRMIASAQPLRPSADVIPRAFVRMSKAITPARKGKDSMKDCVVIESYLHAVSTLRARGFSSKAVFLSSNTKDYLSENNKLRSDLGSEFDALSIEYASNMRTARHLLGV